MSALIRHTLVTLAVGVLVAGPLAALVVALLPVAWRAPAVPWAVAAGVLAVVAGIRGVYPPDA